MAQTGPTPTPTPVLLKQVPATLVPPGNKGVTINIEQYLAAPPAPSNTVLVSSSLGPFCIQLFPTNAPITVANFLRYITSGSYENLMVHRSVPGFIIQTGGYTLTGETLNYNDVATFPAITNEFGLSNTRGTVAMALVGTNPNSGTSQWFVNLTNNSSTLDATNIAGNPPFTVFGQVIGNGMSVVDSIAALPLGDYGSPFDSLPLNFWNTNSSLEYTNLVVITNVVTLPYCIENSNSNTFSTEIEGTNLVLKYLGTHNTAPLTSPVTITACAADTNGNIVQSSFQVSERKLFQNIQFPSNYVVYNGSTSSNYVLTNLPTASSGLPVTITIGSGPAKDFRVLTNQVVTMTTNQVVTSNTYYVTNNLTNGETFTNSVTIDTTNSVTNSITNSFTNNTITLTGAGNVSLVAHQAGNAIYYPAQNEVGYLTVYKAIQTVGWPVQIANQIDVHVPSPILPWNPPTNNSGLPISITVKSGPAKLNPGNTATPVILTGSGTVTLVATQNGNSGYYPARPATNTFTVSAINSGTSTNNP